MRLPLRLAFVLPLVVVVTAGIWLTGAVLTEDATIAMVLTGLWLGLAGVVALGIGWRWRPLALPVVSAYLVTATLLGGYLLATSTVDRVVDEDVLSAAPRTSPGASTEPAVPTPTGSATPSASSSGPVEVAAGTFTDQAHDTSGRATLIEKPDGSRVVTLTDFRTNPGPDVRVYLVPDPSRGVDDAVDLGGLKGNQGDQQYDVPGAAEAGAVVIWCRAFTVAFGTATLR